MIRKNIRRNTGNSGRIHGSGPKPENPSGDVSGSTAVARALADCTGSEAFPAGTYS